MRQPKMRQGKIIPKSLNRAETLPREAKNMLIDQYRRAQNSVKNRENDVENPSEYAGNKVETAARDTVSQGAYLLKRGLALSEGRARFTRERPDFTQSASVGDASHFAGDGSGFTGKRPAVQTDGGPLGPGASVRGSAGANRLKKDVGSGSEPAHAPQAREREPLRVRGRYTEPPTAREAGRNLQSGRYAEQTGRAARGTGQLPSLDRPAEPRASGAGRGASGSFAAVKQGRATLRNGRAPVKAARDMVKTTAAAARSASKARQAAVCARQAARFAARAAKTGAKAGIKIVKLLIRAASLAVKGIITIATGGIPIIIAIVILAAIAALIASPFGILFSGENSGPGVKPLALIAAETNAELTSFIEQIRLNNADADEIHLIFDGSESNTAINNWADVAAVFAVKTALADGDAAADVVTLDAANEARIKAVFWDMTRIETVIIEEERTREVTGEDGEAYTETYIYRIVKIIVDSLSYMEGVALYRFTDDQRAVLGELMKPDNYALLLSLTGAGGMGAALSAVEMAALLAALDGLNADRQAFVSAALSLVGRVNYFWGGKSAAIGWDARWGTPATVTAAGNRTTGTVQPFGLDCTGFVAWCYAQIGVSPALMGWGGDQWRTSVGIEWRDAQPGDLVVFAIPGTAKSNHIGIIVGFDEDGRPLAAHCNASRNNVTVDDAFDIGFRYIRRPVVFAES